MKWTVEKWTYCWICEKQGFPPKPVIYPASSCDECLTSIPPSRRKKWWEKQKEIWEKTPN